MDSNFLYSSEKVPWGNFLESDLQEAVVHSYKSLSSLSKAQILIVGASGFVGSWLAAVLIYAREMNKFDYEVTLTFKNFEKISQSLNVHVIPKLKFILGDLEEISEQISKHQLVYTHVIHAATPTSANFKKRDRESVLNGTSRLIGAVTAKASPNFIHLSSGAVYGLEGRESSAISETETDSMVNLGNWEYAKCKVGIEDIVKKQTKKGNLCGSNPRLFSFIGPHLPIDSTFAIGEFLKSAISNEEISVRGNPKTTRSYMYPTDMTSWIISVLVSPTLDTIHIGSEIAYEMWDLAETVNQVFDGIGANLVVSFELPNHYVPVTSHIRKMYSLSETVSLKAGLERWKLWIKPD